MIKNDSNVLKVLEGKYGKPATADLRQPNDGKGQAGRELEWRGWLVWAGEKTLDELRKALASDLDSYPAWAQARVQKYLRDREANPR